MSWTLEIHHLDVMSAGDATIIIARHPGPPAAVTRTVLVDAGKASKDRTTGIPRAQNVHNYLISLGIASVDVMVATHYDNDHYSGLYFLLGLSSTSIYDNAIVYDQGQPPFHKAYYKRSKKRAPEGSHFTYSDSTDYLKYLRALKNKQNVRRATLYVNSFQIVQYDGNNRHAYPPPPLSPPAPHPPPAPLNIPEPDDWPSPPSSGWGVTGSWLDTEYYNGTPAVGGGPRINDQRPVEGQSALEPFWLLGKEIMWGNGLDGQNGRGGFGAGPVARPPNGPIMTCISANKWTLQAGGNRSFVSKVDIFNGPNRMTNDEINWIENGSDEGGDKNPEDNPKSMGFLLQFNNFKYYIAGDLPEAQEDGFQNFRALGGPVFKNGVRQFLNPNSNMPGRVLLIKTSHHGANTSTSRQFVEQLRPSAAVISCGTNNSNNHPHQRTINVLDGYPHEPINSDPNVNQYQHPNRPPAPLYQPVTHYLTGYQEPSNPIFANKSYGGDASFTAGDPSGSPPVPGHVSVRVSEAESQRPVVGQVYRGIRAAAATISNHFGMTLTAAQLDQIADKGATYGTYAVVALAVGANVQAGIRALEAAAWVGRDEQDESIIETAVAAAKADPGGIFPAFTAINRDSRVSPVAGLASTIANAVNGQTASVITAAGRAAVPPANPNVAHVAGVVGESIFNSFNPNGAIPAGYAVTAAMGAASTPGPNTPSNGQAVTIAAAIALEVYLMLGTASIGVQAGIDVIYDAANAASLPQQQAALAAAVAVAAIMKGSAIHVGRAVQWALGRQGTAGPTADAQGQAALNAANNNAGSLFNVEFHNVNPDYHPLGNVRKSHSY